LRCGRAIRSDRTPKKSAGATSGSGTLIGLMIAAIGTIKRLL